METSATIGQLAKALSSVQGELKPAVFNAINPQFKSKYADLNSIFDCCRELLFKHGLAISQIPSSVFSENGTMVSLSSILMHESGEWLRDTLSFPVPSRRTKIFENGKPTGGYEEQPINAQDIGSAITYARRYSLASMLGIVADIDDDGNNASGKNDHQKQAPEQKEEIKKATAEQIKQINELTAKLKKQEWLTAGLKSNNVLYVRDLTFGQAAKCLDKLIKEDSETDQDVVM